MVTTIYSNGRVPVDDAALGQFRQLLRGRVVTPDDSDYDSVRQIFNRMHDKRPALIVRCTGAADVIDCVNFAREHDLILAVRGGGHNVAGNASCDDGLMIDLSLMNWVQVDRERSVVTVGGGATWGDVDREAQTFGLAVPGGIISETGVAGLTLGGGLGWLRNKYGMSLDNILSVDIVTADGRLLKASAKENSDLFWAIRGGGGNFGVVTAFEFQAHPVGPMVYAAVTMYPVEQAREILPAWRDFMLSAPDEITSNAFFMSIPPFPMFAEENHGRRVIAPIAVHCGPPEEGEAALAEFRKFGTPLEDHSGVFPFRMLQMAFDASFPKGELYHYWKSLNLSRYDDEVIDAIATRASSPASPLAMIDTWRLGGAVGRVGEADTAYGKRDAPFLLVLNTVWDNEADNQANITWTREFWSDMKRFSDGGLYLNFPGQYEEGQDLMRDAFGSNFDRLMQAKKKYDPTNLFRLNQNIDPSAAT